MSGIEVGMNLTTEDKIWRMFRAIGDMAFACAYSPILIEIAVRQKSTVISNSNSRIAMISEEKCLQLILFL